MSSSKHKRFPMILVSLNEASEAPKEVVIKKALEHTSNLQNDLNKKIQQVASPKVSKAFLKSTLSYNFIECFK